MFDRAVTAQPPAMDAAGVGPLFLAHRTAMVRLAVLFVDDLPRTIGCRARGRGSRSSWGRDGHKRA